MFKTLRDAWSIKDIRKKLLYTLFMIIIFRLGCSVVVPFLDTSVVSDWMSQKATNGNFLEYLDILTGGALSQATIFSLSITPYINASIIMQLLTYALPPLERLRDEGEEGQKLYDLALAMNHTEEGDDEAYAKAWFDFIADWNDELPEIPLYSNDYHDFFTSKLHDFEEDGYNWDATNAILYANME